MSGLIKLENLSKDFAGEFVFHEASFQIHPSRHLAILGPSGCGKSTLLRLLAGLDAPSQGRIYIDNEVASEPGRVIIPPPERHIAMVFQDLALWPNLNALQNVLLALSQSGLSRADRKQHALSTLELCGLQRLACRKPAALSIGQQQRVALARALSVRPKLLLLDEPFTGVDLLMKKQLFQEILKLVNRFETTLVMVSHDPMEAMALCSYCAVLENGTLVEHDALESLMQSPKSKTLRTFADSLRNYA